MGIFSKDTDPEQAYLDLRKSLKPRDGLIHVAMVFGSTNIVHKDFECVVRYTVKVDYLLTRMQQDGYSIVDVKASNTVVGGSDRYYTLITYR